jgi:hypothetical protein
MASDEQIRELLAKMQQERDALLTTVRLLREQAAEVRRPEADGEAGWSAKEQLAHLMLMDTSYRSTILYALREDGIVVAGLPSLTEPPSIPMERAHEFSLHELVDEMQRMREQSERLVRGLKPDEFDRTAGNEVFGQLTVMQWLRSYYRHDRMHHAQIRGQESDYKPRYAPGSAEPRQRPVA